MFYLVYVIITYYPTFKTRQFLKSELVFFSAALLSLSPFHHPSFFFSPLSSPLSPHPSLIAGDELTVLCT